MVTYDLYEFLKSVSETGSSHLVTRQSGRLVREKIEEELGKEDEGTVVAIDFKRIGIIDFSCADEVIARVISRLISGEYGDKYVLLTGLDENKRENIEVALERKDLAVSALMTTGERTLIGKLNNYLKKTMELFNNKSKMTAKDVSDILNIEANTSGTRLLNLHKKRLVKRLEEARRGGNIWVYETL